MAIRSYKGSPPTYITTVTDVKGGVPMNFVAKTYTKATGAVTTTIVTSNVETNKRTIRRTGYFGPRVRGARHDFTWVKDEITDQFARLQMPSTSASSTYTVYEGPSGSVYTNGPDGRLPMIDEQGMDYAAAEKAKRYIADHSMDFAVTVAEANETIEMFFNTAKLIARGVADLRKGRISHVLKALKMNRRDISGPVNAWMSYRYGWTPLLADLDNACKALSDTIQKRGTNLRATGKMSDNVSAVSSGAITARNRPRVQVKYYSTKCTLVMRIANADLYRYQQMGVINPLEVAWELVPLSFVADWFLPVGDYLSSLSQTAGLEFVDGFYTKRIETILTKVDRVESKLIYQRTHINDVPAFQINPGNGLNTFRVADALGILYGVLSVTKTHQMT